MRIPIESLDAETLKRVVEEFVTREGTDYGMSTSDLQTKVAQVLRLLKKGEARLFFDAETESCQIVAHSNPAYRTVPSPRTQREDEHNI